MTRPSFQSHCCKKDLSRGGRSTLLGSSQRGGSSQLVELPRVERSLCCYRPRSGWQHRISQMNCQCILPSSQSSRVRHNFAARCHNSILDRTPIQIDHSLRCCKMIDKTRWSFPSCSRSSRWSELGGWFRWHTLLRRLDLKSMRH